MPRKSDRKPCDICGHMRSKNHGCRRVSCRAGASGNNNASNPASVLAETHEMTFTEIGNELGITDERARQIYEKAISKMRKRLNFIDSNIDPFGSS